MDTPITTNGNHTPLSGCETLSQQDTLRQAKLTNDPSPTSSPTTSRASLNGISLQGSGDSRSRAESQGGQTTAPLQAGASPAKTFPRQGAGQDLTATALGFGESLDGSFAHYDRRSRSWRTAQFSLLGGLDEFSETWPRTGSMRNGIAYPPASSAPRTSATVSTSFPTPTFSMGKRGWGFSLSGRRRYSKHIIDTATQYGYKPPVRLLAWLMGYPSTWLDALPPKDLGMRSSPKSRPLSLQSSSGR